MSYWVKNKNQLDYPIPKGSKLISRENVKNYFLRHPLGLGKSEERGKDEKFQFIAPTLKGVN